MISVFFAYEPNFFIFSANSAPPATTTPKLDDPTAPQMSRKRELSCCHDSMLPTTNLQKRPRHQLCHPPTVAKPPKRSGEFEEEEETKQVKRPRVDSLNSPLVDAVATPTSSSPIYIPIPSRLTPFS